MGKLFTILTIVILAFFNTVAQEATPEAEVCTPLTREEAEARNINFYNEEEGYNVSREFKVTVPDGLTLSAIRYDINGNIVAGMLRQEGTVAELPYGGTVWLYEHCDGVVKLSALLSDLRTDLAEMDLVCSVDIWGDFHDSADIECVIDEDECIIHDSLGWSGVEGVTRTFERSGGFIIIVLWRDDYTGIDYRFTVPSWVNATLTEDDGEQYMSYIFQGECSHEYANIAAEAESICKRVYNTDTLRLEECAYE